MIEAMWVMLAACAVFGGFMILSALVTGWLVFRARTNEALFPTKRATGVAINIDELADQPVEDDLPSAIAVQNKVFGARFGTGELKK